MRGNCFSVQTDDKLEYRIVNFAYENLVELLRRGLLWPIKIQTLTDHHAVIYDKRIPNEWYAKEFCTVCCPEQLLPMPQRLLHELEILRGERIIGKHSIQFDCTKRPKI